MIVFPLSARAKRLKAWVRTAATLHCYTNDLRPSSGTKLSEFIEPPRDTGYRPIKILKAGWTIERADEGARAVAAPAVFQFSGGSADVRGLYIVDDEGDLFASELFGAKFEIRRNGDKVEVTVVVDSVDVEPVQHEARA